jgi:enoyl-CoA hydratase/carnithine racemase
VGYVADLSSGGRVALAMHRCHKPTIVALQGSAVGVGMTMTLPAAIRLVELSFQIRIPLIFSSICHEKSKYGFVFTRRGLTIESCASFFLPRLIGLSKAMSLITTGGVFPGSSTYFGDLFTEVLPDAAQVLPRALELAFEMAENVSPLASAMSRALMWEGPQSPEAAHLFESRVFHHMTGQRWVGQLGRGGLWLTCDSDYKEGVNSFLEKRKAHFMSDPNEMSPWDYPWWSEVDVKVGPQVLKESKL